MSREETTATNTNALSVRIATARLFADITSTLSSAAVILGSRLGLYAAMSSAPDGLDPEELARRIGVDHRFVEAWLVNQEESGFVESSMSRRFTLSAAGTAMLQANSDDRDDLLAPLIAAVQLCAELPKIAHALTSGIAMREEDLHEATRDAFRRLSRLRVATWLDEWLVKLPDLAERLRTGAHVLDLGGGEGSLSSALGRRFPESRIRLLDPSAHTHEERFPSNVERLECPISELEERFDLIVSVEAVHHFEEPVAIAKEALRILRDEGRWLIIEPLDTDETRGLIRRNTSAIAALYCVPQIIGSRAIGAGALIDPKIIIELLHDSGFRDAVIRGATAQHILIEGRK